MRSATISPAAAPTPTFCAQINTLVYVCGGARGNLLPVNRAMHHDSIVGVIGMNISLSLGGSVVFGQL